MIEWGLVREAWRDQQAWHGTLVLQAWQWAISGRAHAAWWPQWIYRVAVLAGWFAAGAPPGILLAWHCWRDGRDRDPLALLERRGRGLAWAAVGAIGTVAYLSWPAPILPWVAPLWAGLLLLGLAWVP